MHPTHRSLFTRFRASRLALLAALAPAACSAHAPEPDVDATSSAAAPTTPPPHYNDLRWKATHNAYWVDVKKNPNDPYASGVHERLLDQALHEASRSFELDLHFEAGHSGEFTVYHTDSARDNSTCHYLTDCLDLFRRIDYLEPNHEVVTIVLELKENAGADGHVFGNNGIVGPLKHDHHMEDLDRQLWERLGSRLYAPRELLSDPKCSGLNLRQCVGKIGWPTSDQLRGRYVVTILGNWSDNYWDWIDYAQHVESRAAFPLRSMLTSNPSDMMCGLGSALYPMPDRDKLNGHAYRPAIELNASSLCVNGGHPYVMDKLDDPTFQQRLQTARDASVFWQVEDRRFESDANAIGTDPNGVWTFVDKKKTAGNAIGNGVARLGDQGKSMYDPTNQLAVLTNPAPPAQPTNPDYQMFQTDFPWSFVHSRTPGQKPSMPVQDRPMYQLADVVAGAAPAFDKAYFDEPGARLYFHARTSNQPVMGLVDVTTDSDWEVQATNTVPTHDNEFPPLAKPDSTGCIYAKALTGTDEVRVCRSQQSDDKRTVHVSGWAIRAGVRTDFGYDVPHQEPGHGDVGDLLRMRIVNGARTVNVLTAGTFAPDGTPRWNALQTFTFPAPLRRQGLLATGDVLFVGPKRNGGWIGKASFASFGATEDRASIEDLSHCLNGACMTAHRPDHVTTIVGGDGATYVKVHEAAGGVFGGQARHLYTLDDFERLTSGLLVGGVPDKFLLRQSGDTTTTPLFRCADQRRDYHTHWLSTIAQCPKPVPGKGDPQGESGGVIGHIFTQPLPNTQPLIHMTKGTQNDGTDDTHDHGYAVGQGEASTWSAAYGYTQQEIVGWVYVTPPPAPPAILTLQLVEDATCSGYAAGNVVVTPGGGTCAMSSGTAHTCAIQVAPGQVSLEETTGSKTINFLGWSEPGCSGATCNVNVTASKTVKATFCSLIQ